MARSLKRWVVLVLPLIALSLLSWPAEPQTAVAQVADTTQTLFYNTVANTWTVGGPRLIWLAYPPCTTPGGPHPPVNILRIRTAGSQARVIFSRSDPSQ